MGLIGLIGPGDEPAQRDGNPALFHDLSRVVLVAVKDNPLAPSGQFQSVWQQLGVVELIDVRVHLQRLLVDGLGAEEHARQARGGVHRHLDDLHSLFGGFPHRLRVLGLNHKGGVVARPCQRGALLMEDAGIIWRMGAGDMTNLHPFFSLLSFDCFFTEGGASPSWGILQGRWPLHPPFGRSAPNPGLLSCEKKVGKDSPKPAVLDSLVREDRPYRAALRLHTGSSQPLIQTDLPLWAGGVNWSCFLPAPYRGYTFSCQSVARQVRCSRGCLRGLLTATNTARAQGRGIKGGLAPFAGGQDFFEV